MNVAAQFRKAIARRLAHISSCSEAEVLAALGTPKTSLMHQFNIPLPRVFPKDRLPDARDLADKVHFHFSLLYIETLNVYIYYSLVHVIHLSQTYLLLASSSTLVCEGPSTSSKHYSRCIRRSRAMDVIPRTYHRPW